MAASGHDPMCAAVADRRAQSLRRLFDCGALSGTQLAAAMEAVEADERLRARWDLANCGEAVSGVMCPMCGVCAARLYRRPTLRSAPPGTARWHDPGERYHDGTAWAYPPLPMRGRCAVAFRLTLPPSAAPGSELRRPCVVGLGTASARKRGTHLSARCWGVAADARDRVGPASRPLGDEAVLQGRADPTLFGSGDLVVLIIDADRGTLSLRVNDLGYGVVHTTLPVHQTLPPGAPPAELYPFVAMSDVGCTARVDGVMRPLAAEPPL
eukprot:TRINITY_DN29438_c0_g1_i2.p1 TRINITY_DN29438_c0_g1~~TRINITY_DN29438_c0_g1_i2.p1  ORF type:complete len:268 (+),score=28.62 TRINITY_DN29438_c0_g1_i2:75-878(+)